MNCHSRSITLLLGMMLFLFACVGFEKGGDDPYRLQKISDLELCNAFGGLEDSFWGNISRERLEGELHRRDLFSKNEWILIRDRRIGKGMSLCSLLASWGPGRSSYRREGSYSDYSIKSVRYQSCRTCPLIEVEIKSNKVAGWRYPGNWETYPQIND